MSPTELSQLAYDLSFTAGMNQEYYQIMETYWANWDLAIRITVAVLALASLIATAVGEFDAGEKAKKPAGVDPSPQPNPPKWWLKIAVILSSPIPRFWNWQRRYSWGLKLSCLSAIAAAILNLSPTAENARRHSDLYRQWTAMRREVDELRFDLKSIAKDADPEAVCGTGRWHRLLATRAQIEALEPAPNQKLVEKAAHDESERRWGKGVKTYQERLKENEEKNAAAAATPSTAPAG